MYNIQNIKYRYGFAEVRQGLKIIQPPLWLWRGCGKDEVEEKDHLPSGAGDPSGKSSCVHEKTSCSALRKWFLKGKINLCKIP